MKDYPPHTHTNSTPKELKKIIIYGAGATGKLVYDEIINENIYTPIAFADYTKEKQGTTYLGLEIIHPKDIEKYNYDFVAIGTILGLDDMYNDLINKYSVPEHLILRNYAEYSRKARITFLEYQSIIINEKNLTGCIAEGGVYQGDFARRMNIAFPERTFYLFDTFKGFDKRDVDFEKECSLSNNGEGYLSNSSLTYTNLR